MTSITICNDYTYYYNWSNMFFCIDPLAWAYMGVALSLGLSIIGAAWYACYQINIVGAFC